MTLTKRLAVLAASSGIAAAAAASAFHDAPDWARGLKNPFGARDTGAIREGAALFASHCASCHGSDAMGMGNVPALGHGPAQLAPEGEVFWFIGKGSPQNGMPPSGLEERQRWEIVTYLRSLGSAAHQAQRAPAPAAPSAAPQSQAPSPPAPFTDYRFQKPGQLHHILPTDLPRPVLGPLVANGPSVVARPADAWPKVPPGFEVGLFASGLENPRLLRTAPNGDVFVAESEPGRIRVFRGLTAEGKPRQSEVFAKGLERPYGIAFYPPGAEPRWLYVGEENAVVRFAYHPGDLRARSAASKVAELPGGSRGHWTRDLTFNPDGTRLYVAVGSASNDDDPDVTPREKDRADILAMNPEGGGRRVYASGIRNAGGGIAINPATGELWCSVNERDGLGDNLVPDYLTRVREGGFYGWPWWYVGGHQDPRHPGRHSELKGKLVEPDVLLQPHNASLELAFYEGKQFPPEYRGDVFAAQHGSWNRSVRTGYELIRVPLHQAGRASGEYEDFMTGFVVDGERAWGRPVGVAVASDGSLLVSDDGSNSIWRISYKGR